ncbi:hypothetical protein LBBP_00657 [Leptospira borgpetersenii serovar Ballum]|uniref:Uncharacterized protein n=1 Tax=Leptospira borgpetersenii serovar Ballum TaxID=280505 RepID=A0A0S2IP25_LEPBO|nr:hypothetical protein LBBP_00657 [Leptospira borgpetersenii serovar Ballum]
MYFFKKRNEHVVWPFWKSDLESRPRTLKEINYSHFRELL